MAQSGLGNLAKHPRAACPPVGNPRECAETARHGRLRRKLPAPNQRPKLTTRLARDLDGRHRLKLGKRHGLAAPGLLDRLLRSLPCPRNPVEDFGYPRRVGIGFVQSTGEK